jgi:WD40 repeat protein/tetratricopeptide (TPR) repeat protein
VLDVPQIKGPYPGLRSFRSEERGIFFGREEQTDELLAHLEDARLLAVAGESGCGKSSLVRAGLIPALEAGFLSKGASHWRVATLRPENRPIHNLAWALIEALGDGRQNPEDVPGMMAMLRRGSLGIVELLRGRELAADTELLILVDQFEELIRFRSRMEVEEADSFVALLLETARSELPVRIVLTLRTDYLGKCALFRGLAEALNRAHYLTPLLTRDQLHEAIVSPARVFGGDVDPVLANQIVNEVGLNQDQLPVVQHALMWMWSRAQANADRSRDETGAAPVLTLSDYDKIGGLGEALAKHADQVYDRLPSDEDRRIARRMLCALWEEDGKFGDNRRPCKVSEARAIAGVSLEGFTPVVDAFRAPEHAFVTPLGGELQDGDMLDVSHESLFRHWKSLKDWTRDEAQRVEGYREWRGRASKWEQGKGDLLMTADLKSALKWKVDATPNPDWAVRYGGSAADYEDTVAYLEASRRAQWVRRGAAFMVGMALLAALGYLVVRYRGDRLAEETRIARERRERVELFSSGYAVSGEPFRALQLAVEAAEGDRDGVTRDETGRPLSPRLEASVRVALRQSRLRALLVASNGAFSDARLMPDGLHAVTVGPGDGLAVWDLASGGRQKALFGAEMSPSVLAIDDSGRLAATAGDTGFVDLWDLQADQLRVTLEGNTHSVKALAFSPDGALVASAGDDGSLRLWETRDGQSKFVLFDHVGPVNTVAFTHDGERIASGGDDGRIVLWDARSGRKLRLLRREPREVSEIVFNATGGVLASSTGSVIALSDPVTRRFNGVLAHTNRVTSIAFNGQGRQLASVGLDGTLRVWEVATKTERLQLWEESALQGQSKREQTEGALSKNGWFQSVSFSRDGRHLITTSLDGTAKVWAVFAGAERGVYPAHSDGIDSIAVAPDGKRIATGSRDGTAAVWEWRRAAMHKGDSDPLSADLHEIFRTPKGAPVGTVSFDPTGTVLAMGEGDRVTLWDAPAGQAVRPSRVLPTDELVKELRFYRGGARLAAAAGTGIRAWDLPDGEIAFDIDAKMRLFAIAVSPDDRLIASECRDDVSDEHHAICLWDASDGKRLASFGSDVGSATGAGHALAILGLGFTGNGERLVSVSKDKMARIWDVKARALVGTLEGHRESIMGIAISADGKRVATAGDDFVRVWNAKSRVPQEGFPDVMPGGDAVAFTPDGDYLIAGAREGVLRFYPMDAGALVPLAKQRVPLHLSEDECRRYSGADCFTHPAPSQLVNQGRLAFRDGDAQRGMKMMQTAFGGSKERAAKEAARFEAARAVSDAKRASGEVFSSTLREDSFTKAPDAAGKQKALMAALVRVIEERAKLRNVAFDVVQRSDPGLRLISSDLEDWCATSWLLGVARIAGESGDSEFVSNLLRLAPGRSPDWAGRTSAALIPSAIMHHAFEKLKAGDASDAVRVLDSFNVPPDDRRFLLWLRLGAQAYAAAGMLTDAVALAEALANRVHDSEALTDLASLLLLAKAKSSGAERALRNAISADQGNDRAKILLGVWLHDHQQHRAAVQILDEVPRGSPDYEDASGLKGVILYEDLKDTGAAYRSMAVAAMERHPGDWANLAEAAWSVERLVEARLVARRVLAAEDVDEAEPYVQLAMRVIIVCSLVREGAFVDAERELRILIEYTKSVLTSTWRYDGTKAAAAHRIKQQASRKFILRLLDYAQSLGKQGDGEELIVLLRDAARKDALR